MAPLDDRDDEALAAPDAEDENAQPVDTLGEEEKQSERLSLEVNIDSPSACERHITVTVPEEDVRRYFDKEISQLMPEAHVPGFRPGRAPRRLVEARFRKEVAERVKADLLVDCLEQIREEYNLAAINEPEIDLDAVEVPDRGPMIFEFDLEVRPEFTLPEWKGLQLERPNREITSADVDQVLEELLSEQSRLVPRDGAAELGDYVSVNVRSEHEGRRLAEAEEQMVRVLPTLSFPDAQLEGFDQLIVGVRSGDRREAEVELAPDAPNEALRGCKVKLTFEVLEVKRLEIPELTEELLRELGDYQSESDLRDGIESWLERRLEYEQRRALREQVTELLTASADWELPPTLLERQAQRELERQMLELRRSGFSEGEIAAREFALRRNVREATARALKEHFILERIAEEEGIEATETDYDAEIGLIALQRRESPRRVRARLEKAGMMDVLRNQIIERKVLDLILSHAQLKDVPYEFERPKVATLAWYVGGRSGEIPEAQPEHGEPHPATPPPEPPVRE